LLLLLLDVITVLNLIFVEPREQKSPYIGLCRGRKQHSVQRDTRGESEMQISGGRPKNRTGRPGHVLRVNGRCTILGPLLYIKHYSVHCIHIYIYITSRPPTPSFIIIFTRVYVCVLNFVGYTRGRKPETSGVRPAASHNGGRESSHTRFSSKG